VKKKQYKNGERNMDYKTINVKIANTVLQTKKEVKQLKKKHRIISFIFGTETNTRKSFKINRIHKTTSTTNS